MIIYRLRRSMATQFIALAHTLSSLHSHSLLVALLTPFGFSCICAKKIVSTSKGETKTKVNIAFCIFNYRFPRKQSRQQNAHTYTHLHMYIVYTHTHSHSHCAHAFVFLLPPFLTVFFLFFLSFSIVCLREWVMAIF